MSEERKNIDDGGPAFPTHERDDMRGYGGGLTFVPVGGMTLRDYFAAQALQGMLSALGRNEMWQGINQTASTNGVNVTKHLATLAYEHADAMLAARRDRGP